MEDNRYLRYIIFLMLLGGVYKVQTQSFAKRKLFQIWRLTVSLNLLYVFFSVSVDLAQKGLEQFDRVVLNFLYVFVTVLVFFKANYYYFFDGKSEEIYAEMRRLFKYRTETLLDEKDLKRCIDVCRKFSAVWFTFGVTAAQGFIVMFLVFNAGSERKLPLPFWFPYDWKTTPIYELTVLYQFFIHQIMIFAVVGTDLFFASVVLLTSEQFTLLGWEIKHLLYTVLLKNGISKKEVNSIQGFINSKPQVGSQEEEIAFGIIDELLTLPKIKASLLEEVKRHIQFHQSLLKFCNSLEDFFSPMYLPYFFIIFIIDVFDSFIITTTRDTTLGVTVVLYMIAITITLIVGCYSGQLLTTRVEALQQDVFDYPWYICDKNFKFQFKFLHLRTCKPVVLTVGKIAPLQLNTFLWILKSVTSYVIVLYQLTEENRRAA